MYKKRAKNVIDFIEKLTVPSGINQGKPFKLEKFQKDFINDVYGPTRYGKRKVRRAVFSLGRKNGKTALIAAIVINHLVGPEAIQNGEIYSAANDREQAAQVFKIAAQIVRADKELSAVLRIVDSTKTIVCYPTGTFYRAISAEAGTKHGLNPSVVIYDELAQARNRELYDVLDTAMGAREEPLFITISTQSNDPQHILSQLIDDGLNSKDSTTVTHLYTVPEDVEDIFDENIWKLANPALGSFRSMEDMRTQAERAKRMPSFESKFRNLYLNQRIDAKSPAIPRVEWMGCKTGETIEKGEKIYLGLDLSGTTDLSALVAVSASGGDRIKGWFWKPEDTLIDHEKKDRVPYRLWRDSSYLETTPGRTINFNFIANKIGEIGAEYKIAGIAFDRWRIENFIQSLTEQGIDSYIEGRDELFAGAVRMVPWGQGFKDMAPAIDALEAAILERNLKHNGNPVLTWCISNAVAVSDPVGNRKFDKTKTRFRIDGAVALAMAIGLKKRDVAEPQAVVSPWENPEFRICK